MNQSAAQLQKFENTNRVLYRLGLLLVLCVVVIWAFLAINRPWLNEFLTDPGRDAKHILTRYEKVIPQTENERILIEQNKALIGMNGIIVKIVPLTFFLMGLLILGLLMIGASARQRKVLDFAKGLVK